MENTELQRIEWRARERVQEDRSEARSPLLSTLVAAARNERREASICSPGTREALVGCLSVFIEQSEEEMAMRRFVFPVELA